MYRLYIQYCTLPFTTQDLLRYYCTEVADIDVIMYTLLPVFCPTHFSLKNNFLPCSLKIAVGHKAISITLKTMCMPIVESTRNVIIHDWNIFLTTRDQSSGIESECTAPSTASAAASAAAAVAPATVLAAEARPTNGMYCTKVRLHLFVGLWLTHYIY